MVIIAHELAAVFVKTRKTAGTSIELAFSACCGPRDVITPNSPEDEALRALIGGRAPQNFEVRLNLGEIILAGPQVWRAAIRGRERAIRKFKYRTHDPAALLRERLGGVTWERFVTFAVERNPWDRAVSDYYWQTRGMLEGDRPPFSSWLNQPERSLSNWDLYADGDQIIVRHMLRFETLAIDLAGIWSMLGISPPALPAAKGRHRPRGIPYQAMYTTADRELIARACWREIRAFGYEFE